MVLTIYVLCFAFLGAVWGHGAEHDHTDDCRKAESLFYSLCSQDPITLQTIQGSPGKRGAPGAKGDIGVGVQGPPGVVDYERVDSDIDRKLEQALSSQNAKIAELTASLERAEQKIGALEGREGFCYVKYNNKCFWVETNYAGINWVQGEAMCATHGGVPANIYSESHYTMVTDYLRRQLLTGDGIIYVWLGLRFNVQTMTVTLSDGSRAPTFPSYPGYPKSNSGWNNISLNVRGQCRGTPDTKESTIIHPPILGKEFCARKIEDSSGRQR